MMIHLFTDPDAAREQFTKHAHAAKAIADLSDAAVEWSAVRIPRGTAEGNSTVIFHVISPDGTLLVLQTSLRLLDGLVSAFKGADLRDAERPSVN